MSLTVILLVAIALSVAFHFVGVLADAKKTVWLMLVLVWAGSINIAMSEVKPKAYEDIKKMQGEFADTDALIKEAGEHVSIYEMIKIKHSYQLHKPKQ
jgi:predicted nucleic-acid-binding protein